tara:strand:+ start:800 stop:1135 length:336 start_codon:yes stop_codon:yes gene_type:complete
MWKEVLKIDMDEARRLGEKYAPEDMEEASLNRNMVNTGKEIKRHTKIFKDIKEKIMANKSKIIAKEPTVWLAMQSTLDLMEESIGTDEFMMYRSGLVNLSRGHDIFYRGSP